MRTLQRPGARVSYEVLGSGAAVVLGHSLLCDGRMWDPVLPALAAGHRVYNVDLRGHRRSTADRPFTLDDVADDWLALLDAEGIDRATLIGLSTGGMTAMRLALRAPDRVAGMALLDTSADREPPAARARFLALAEMVRVFGSLRPFVPVIERELFGATTRRVRPDLVAEWRPRYAEHPPKQLHRACHAVFRRPSIFDRLGDIRCPTAVIVGAEDTATPAVRARRIAAAIPGAWLVQIPKAGHLTPLEAPEPTLAALLDLLGATTNAGR